VPYQDDEEDSVPTGLHLVEPEPQPVQSVNSSALVPHVQREEVVENGAGTPALTIQDVKEQWELVKRRIRTKKDGGKIAAFLNGYTILGIDRTVDLPVIVLRANAAFHYTALQQKKEYHEIVEWAMKIELKQECKIRLVQPGSDGGLAGASLRPSVPPSDSRSVHMSSAMPASPPAHRERPAQPASPQKSYDRAPEQARIQDSPADKPVSATNGALPLARTGIVRENTNVSSFSPVEVIETPERSETRLVSLKKKSTNNQVVQRVAEMFKAEIKEVRPK
jgi:hypothetical protein